MTFPARPTVILFDWHATLVDTLDAMYHAVDDVLPQMEELGLIDRMIKADDAKTIEDAKLVNYVRDFRRLHPRIKTDRKISRTDIFEVLFGPDIEAKHIAHAAFNHCYRNHYGDVHPFEEGVKDVLVWLKEAGLMVGVLTNRDREFLEYEIDAIDGTGWRELFDTTVCGDDTQRRKPACDPILKALENIGVPPGQDSWYVGDSTTDTIAANRAGITSVFFNGAKWSQAWLDKIFPGTEKHPDKPDIVVNDFMEFRSLVARCLGC